MRHAKHVARMGEDKRIPCFRFKNFNMREYQDADGRKILKFFLEKMSVRIWAGFH
jgi:hypothetical protein